MKKANCNCVLYQQLEQIRLSDRDRQSAIYALRDAEAIVHALIWAGRKIASLGAAVPALRFKH